MSALPILSESVLHGLKEVCEQCGSVCCRKGSPLVAPEERNEIVAKSGLDHMKQEGEFFRMKGEPCPYLCEAGCAIHRFKPVVCKAWPITLKCEVDRIVPVIVEKEECPAATTSHVSQTFVVNAVNLLSSMPVRFQRRTASLTKEFGFRTRPIPERYGVTVEFGVIHE